MNFLRQLITHLSVRQLIVFALVLCLGAFLINLGTVAFIGDEAIRSLVAFEMYKTGDFVVPTLNGQEYYNKPPLYNWLIYANSMLFGSFGEWPARITTLLFLAAFGYTVYYYSRKHFDILTSASLAFMLLTSGRILFWDSMLGLIDICFSWIIFLQWMIMYHAGKEGRWKSFFILSYGLFALAFLLKGLPAVVFHGLSLPAALIFHKEFKKKFISLDHVLGILSGLAILLAYYIPYADRVSLQNVLAVLFDQSMQRTGTHHGAMKTIIHLFTFPLEQFYHFLPWTLLLIPVFVPGFRQRLQENRILQFSVLMFAVNIPVYWISVQVYPRYLLMFLPLLHLTGYYLLFHAKDIHLWIPKTIRGIFMGMIGLAFLATLGMGMYQPLRSVPYFPWIWMGGTLLMAICLTGIWFEKTKWILWMCISLLAVRTIFNLTVIPLRAIEFTENKCREDIRRLASQHADHPWLIYGETETHQVARFYTSAYSDQVIRKTNSIADPKAYYIVDKTMYADLPLVAIDSFILERNQVLHLMKTIGQ